jgi:hypothetical protein
LSVKIGGSFSAKIFNMSKRRAADVGMYLPINEQEECENKKNK